MKKPKTSARPDAVQLPPPRPFAGPTVKARGVVSFRSGTAKDLAAILDVDSNVDSWSSCVDFPGADHIGHLPDFRMLDTEGVTWILDAPDRARTSQNDLEAAARDIGAVYRLVPRIEIYSGFRLRNARDLLRYANYTVTLADRIRLLATLDEQGSLPMADCLSVLRVGEPVAAVAALMLHGFVEADLDEALLGPETMVRRIRS